jgi:hypothetical protein
MMTYDVGVSILRLVVGDVIALATRASEPRAAHQAS